MEELNKLSDDELFDNLLDENYIRFIYWNRRYLFYRLDKCPYCNRNCNSANSLMSHLRYHKEFCELVGVRTRVGFENVKLPEVKRTCEYCNREYNNFKSLFGHYPSCIPRLKVVYKSYIDENPILNCITDPESDSTKTIVAKYINFKDPISTLKYYRDNDLYLGSFRLSISLMYYYGKYDNLVEYLTNYFELHSTWDLAETLNMDQLSISRIFGCSGLGLVSISKLSSKIHLQTKPIIEGIIGYKTLTEYYVGKYRIDEYCKELKIGFEIDGKWCHDEDYDNCRDKFLLDSGIKIIRIPAYSTYDEIKNIIESNLITN